MRRPSGAVENNGTSELYFTGHIQLVNIHGSDFSLLVNVIIVKVSHTCFLSETVMNKMMIYAH